MSLFRKTFNFQKCLYTVVLYHTSSVRCNKGHLVKRIKPVKIWNNMTIWDLTKEMKKSLDYLETVIKPNLKGAVEPELGCIQDLNQVESFLKSQGVDFKVIDPVNPSHLKQLKKLSDLVNKPVEVKKSTGNQVKRPPVVTIMGHVDHGKTTLLDALRNSCVTASEFGGITQHIGAFTVNVSPETSITFIDTPGHAAFKAMRNRGAQATDIVVLVIAADDGVMDQTIESVNMAKTAGVPIIVAVNKIDKVPKFNMDGISENLMKLGILCEKEGGDTQVVPISALKKTNLNLLIEAILIEADVQKLTGSPDGSVDGVVIESKHSPAGKVATVLLKNGTIRKKSLIVAGDTMARVRNMMDENDKPLEKSSLSQPLQVFGWKEIPKAGEKIVEVSSLDSANKLIAKYKARFTLEKIKKDFQDIQMKSIEHNIAYDTMRNEKFEVKKSNNIQKFKEFYRNQLYSKKEEIQEPIKLDILVKGDVEGSVDAILHVINTYTHHDECKLGLVDFDVGPVNRNDLELAATFNAIIYCFNLPYPDDLKEEISEKSIKIRVHNVIYSLIDDLKLEISEKLPLQTYEQITGEAVVNQHFSIMDKRKEIPVAGCTCISGELVKTHLYRVIRDDVVIFEGECKSMRHLKNESDVIKKNTDCGLMLKDFPSVFQKDDKIICYQVFQKKVSTSWNPGF